MAAFDPKAYADAVNAQDKAFDPAAYAAAVDAETAKPAPAPTLGAGATGAFHAARHLAAGLGDKIIAAAEALSEHGGVPGSILDALSLQGLKYRKPSQESFSDVYARNLAFNDKLLEDSDKAHPVARWVGNLSGVAGNTAALAAVAPLRALLAARGLVPAAEAAGPAVGTLAGLLRGAKEGGKLGSAMGAVGGYGADRSDSMGGTLASAGVGGVAGGLGGLLLGALGGGISGKLAQRAQPRATDRFAQALAELQKTGDVPGLPMAARSVEPITEAQTLQRYGVPLTLRQMAPEGPLAEISEASERVPLLGRAVQAQERAPLAAWRDVVMRQAMPGEGPMVNGDVADKLGDIQGQISALYKHVEGAPAKIAAVHPDTGEIVNPVTAFKAIMEDPNYQASDSDLRIVGGVLKDQLGKLYRTTEANRLVPKSSINAGLLMNVRSGLRQAAQDASGEQGGAARAQMFRDAAESISGGIKASLPPEQLGMLQRADAAYANFSRVAAAAQRAGNQIGEGEFGPQRLSAELLKAYGRKFATNSEAGGSLRELARAGKVVFTPRDVKTGHGEFLKSALGATLGNFIRSANENPSAQAAFTEAAQRAAQSSSPGLSTPAAGAFESAMTRYLQGVPAGTLPAESLNALAASVLGGRGGSGQ